MRRFNPTDYGTPVRQILLPIPAFHGTRTPWSCAAGIMIDADSQAKERAP
jgi:hypothetical protein